MILHNDQPRRHQVFVRARIYSLAIIVLGMLGGASALLGHHSFSMFDTAKTVMLSGTVTSFEWTNPHAYIEIDVPAEARGGAAKHWSVEMGSPSILQQSGWKFKDLKFGDKVSVSISPLRNGDPGGLLIQATLPDGRVLGNGPGRGPAAPAAPRGAK
jgi:hypothetical protein